MKEWLRYFKIWFLICAIVLVVFGVWRGVSGKGSSGAERINTVCTETERVFDFADVLTDKEEESLRELIAKREKQTQCDIVLVIMNESLEEYARGYDPYASGNEYTMIKADNFYDEYGFGWNKTKESDDGDGVLLLDNWYRESDGKVYTWFSTSGKAERAYSNARIEHLLDEVYEYIETSPYKAYRAYIETFYRDMTGKTEMSVPWPVVLIVPSVAAVIFVLFNLSGKEGKKTTQATTYLQGGHPNFTVNHDRFIRKSTTSRRIQTSSGGGGGGGHSGGGGHHTSSGGHSHGGGGRSR